MKKTLLASLSLLILAGNSCKRNNDNNPTVSTYGTYSSLDTIYEMLSVKPLQVNLTVSTGGSFYGKSGTRYIFKPDCFQDGLGNNVTGTVQISVAEYLKQGDMVFSKMLPMSNDQPLVSAGEISVSATQGGQPVYLKPVPGCRFQANIPQGKTADPSMAVFIGRPYPQTGNFAGLTNVNWSLDTVGTGAIIVAGDTVSIFADSMNMFNGDHYVTGVPTAHNSQLLITVVGDKSLENVNLKIFTLVDNSKDIWPLWGTQNMGSFSDFLVVGKPCHIVAYALIDHRFYAGSVAISPNTTTGFQNNFSMLLAETDPVAFKGQLNTLY